MIIKWPQRITNEELMIKTKQTIRKNRMSWYGYVCQLDEPKPAQTALKHFKSNSNMKKLRGGQNKNTDKKSGERPIHLETAPTRKSNRPNTG